MSFNPEEYIDRGWKKFKSKTRRRVMARRQVGSVMKKSEDKLKYTGANGKPIPEFYIKITEDVNLKKGDFVNLENKAIKLASLEANRGKMSEEVYNSAMERIEKMPDFVTFELIRVTRD